MKFESTNHKAHPTTIFGEASIIKIETANYQFIINITVVYIMRFVNLKYTFVGIESRQLRAKLIPKLKSTVNIKAEWACIYEKNGVFLMISIINYRKRPQ